MEQDRMPATAAHEAALEMLSAFASVGATRFDLTWTWMVDGQKRRSFRGGQQLAALRQNLPFMLGRAIADRRNLIIRPHDDPTTFLQLDDLNEDALARVQPLAFLTLTTSPGNHQAWLALSVAPGADFLRRVRKGTGADPTASGATRIAGSLNFKDRYAPDFPRVAIWDIAAGRTVTPAQLEAGGLVAPFEPPPRVSAVVKSRSPDRKWPSYQMCLDGAPAKHGGDGPDVSRADFTFALISASWGWSTEDIAQKLMEESDKARQNGERYAKLTATKAAAAAANNRNASAQRSGSR